jgi:hypothetical protein
MTIENITLEFLRKERNRLQWKLDTNKITKEEFDNKIIELENVVEKQLKANRDFEINKAQRVQGYIDDWNKKELINILIILVVFGIFVAIYKIIN